MAPARRTARGPPFVLGVPPRSLEAARAREGVAVSRLSNSRRRSSSSSSGDALVLPDGRSGASPRITGHRDDLDVFVSAPSDRRVRQVAEARSVAAIGRSRPSGPRRISSSSTRTEVIVDLVRDRAPQIYADKLDRDGVLVDPPAEILANKLCTLLSRGEVRDLVDVLFLERSGLRVEDALVPASTKDGGPHARAARLGPLPDHRRFRRSHPRRRHPGRTPDLPRGPRLPA